ncbi:hypothetical protein H9L14_04860 [Sphingomonas sediminicola]|uniref:Uncharacterized protein n=1 Tax=Sphingomonas sediminicola TaxID=386874 RepID=A0ABX6TFW6_9SPHN|nr:hypothetical protein [Sphingomonas sediminicola]QNP46488.1 hypothetical protein H9L14_04860 [Sphingomonas sediminicola]
MLRIPPFPGAMTSNLARPAADVELGRGRVEALVDRIRKARVGGTYWAAQPRLSASYVLARTPDALATAKRVLSDAPIVLWSTQKTPHTGFTVTGDCDPWHMLSGALGLFTNDEDNEILTIAAILGVPTYVRGKSRDFELEGGMRLPGCNWRSGTRSSPIHSRARTLASKTRSSFAAFGAI